MSKKEKRQEKRDKYASAASRLAFRKGAGERTAIKLPKDVTLFQPKEEGTYRLEIIPYKLGKKNSNKNVEPGQFYYEMTYWVHPRIGANQDSYTCPAKMNGGKCPVCEHRLRIEKKGADKKDIDALRPKERQLFNVLDLAEPEKGVQIWEISFHNFGKHLDKKVRTADDEEREEYEMFAHPKKGKTIRVSASEEYMGKQKYLEFSDIEFKDRKEPIDPEVLEAAVSLEDLPIILDYKELKKIFLQGGTDDDEEEDDDEEDESKDDDEDDAEGDDDEDDAEDDADAEDDDEESEWSKGDQTEYVYKGKRKKGKIKKINTKRGLAMIQVPGEERLAVIDLDELMKPKKSKKDDDEDEDEGWDEDDEDKDDDEPKPKKKKKSKKDDDEDDDDEDDDD